MPTARARPAQGRTLQSRRLRPRRAILDGLPATGHWNTDANGRRALIGHSTDWFPGDGLTDLIARMPDGKLYIYPGIGTGQFDVARRTEILLPPGAPEPATFRQIIVTEDIDGDGLADMFALDADSLWAFSGYTGSSRASMGESTSLPSPRQPTP
ncbi:FG-GAP repeat domain-containing protein [Streptomyces subrutilus]|uniref:FG-GAP repeat domain-containing protein n=1 Tax=Streptomyces subrutilus TaxID=36818 RepID=UPI003406D20A